MILFTTMVLIYISKSMKKKNLLRHLARSDEYVHVDILILFVINCKKKSIRSNNSLHFHAVQFQLSTQNI